MAATAARPKSPVWRRSGFWLAMAVAALTLLIVVLAWMVVRQLVAPA